MARKVIDCRQVPSDINCTLTIAGEEDEVVRAGVLHAVDAHGHKDTPELREMIRSGLQDEGGFAPNARREPAQPSAAH